MLCLCGLAWCRCQCLYETTLNVILGLKQIRECDHKARQTFPFKAAKQKKPQKEWTTEWTTLRKIVSYIFTLHWVSATDWEWLHILCNSIPPRNFMPNVILLRFWGKNCMCSFFVKYSPWYIICICHSCAFHKQAYCGGYFTISVPWIINYQE